MKTTITTIALLTALGIGISEAQADVTPTSLSPEDAIASDEPKHRFVISPLFNYRWAPESPANKEFMAADVELLDSFGLTDFLNVSEQLPAIGLEVGYGPNFPLLLPRDELTAFVSFLYSSSALFGEEVTSRTFSPIFDPLPLDHPDATATFTNQLHTYASIGAGFTYAPHQIGSEKTVMFSPIVAFYLGAAYKDFETRSHIPLDADLIGQPINANSPDLRWKDILNPMGVYEDTLTVTRSKGWSYWLKPGVGFDLKIIDQIKLSFIAGYMWEFFPGLEIEQTMYFNGEPQETKKVEIDDTLHGPYVEAKIGWEYKF
ncbi:hypothetical protein HN587_01610 [Candidatus Woesearchaeota archaeon]|jgi:hypothetical protein|nr:hypothetical protein [Candidatus Woesearchaeota archaeon]